MGDIETDLKAPDVADVDPLTDEEAYTSPDKGPLRLRAKKFLASKTAGTKLGRKIINRFLGPKGEKIIEALTGAACKLHGKKDAKAALVDLYKIATKIKIMADEKILTASNTVDADEPLNLLGVQILDALSTEGKYKVEPLHRTIEQLRVIVTALMKGHLQEKNYKKMNSLFEIYGSTEFLEVVMNDKTYESEKKDLFENLSILLKEQMVELENKRARARPKKCQSYGCPYLSLAPEGKFLGSKYCAMHHLAIYGPRTSCVCTDYFVKEVETSKYLTSHLKANGEDIKAKFKYMIAEWQL